MDNLDTFDPNRLKLSSLAARPAIVPVRLAFSLLTYRDVKQRVTQIADVTTRRVMPPWKPEERGGQFVDERVLTTEP